MASGGRGAISESVLGSAPPRRLGDDAWVRPDVDWEAHVGRLVRRHEPPLVADVQAVIEEDAGGIARPHLEVLHREAGPRGVGVVSAQGLALRGRVARGVLLEPVARLRRGGEARPARRGGQAAGRPAAVRDAADGRSDRDVAGGRSDLGSPQEVRRGPRARQRCGAAPALRRLRLRRRRVLPPDGRLRDLARALHRRGARSLGWGGGRRLGAGPSPASRTGVA